MKTCKRCLFIFFVLSCCVGCDQVSKEVARRALQGSAMTSWWYDTIRLQYAENSGAFLSIGSHLPATARFWILIMIPGLVLFGMLGVSIYATGMRLRERIGLALIIGGGLSNLFDPAFSGWVRDRFSQYRTWTVANGHL